MKKTLNVSDQIINYHLTYKRIKNLYVKMDDNFNIIVSAPTSMSIKRIEDFLIEVYPRLLKRQRRKTKSKEIPVNETSIKILGVYEDKQKDINE
ncbi:TPA: M48 family metallopeptidase, partial [bacterium]|nr:M48 family metallopeptidase [bacterium]